MAPAMGELCADELSAGPGGKLAGKISVRQADVLGGIREELVMAGHLIVRGGGHIRGQAPYGEVEESGAVNIQGALRRVRRAVRKRVMPDVPSDPQDRGLRRLGTAVSLCRHGAVAPRLHRRSHHPGAGR